MKIILHFKALLLVISLLVSSSIIAQSLNGGTITSSSVCASVGTPAPDLTNITAASGGVLPYTYQWEAKIDFSNWTNVVTVGNGLNLSPGILSYTTTYRRKVTDAAGVVTYSNEIKIFKTELNPGNIAFAYAASPFLVGSSPLIIGNIGLSGTGSYSYSWEVSSSAAGPWSIISGVNNLNYQTSVFTSPGVWYYRRKTTDLICTASSYSNILRLEIVTSLNFNPGFWGTQYLCVLPGSTPSLLQGSVPTGGTEPYSYQWEQKLVGAATWQPISGATSNNYQPPVLANNTMFRRNTGDANGNTGYTNEETIFVLNTTANPGAIAINTTNIAPNAPYIAAVELQSASNAHNGIYAWQEAFNGGSWINIPNYDYNNYYPQNQPTSITCYRRAIREYCAGGNRDTWTDYVCFYPAAPLTDGTISFGSGNSGCVTPSTSPGIITGTPATGGSTPYTYQWQSFDGTAWSNIASANAVSYTPPALNHDTKYRRIVTDAAGATLTSNEVSITIKSTSPLKGGIIDGPIVTCSNTSPGIINNILDACGGGGTFTYTWEKSTNGGSWAAISGTNQPTHNASSISADTKYRRKVGDGCGNAVYSNEVPVYVYPSIEAGTITPSSQTVCSNAIPELLGLTQNCHYTNGNVTYQWQRSTSASGPWTNINGATQPVLLPKMSNISFYYQLVVTSSVCNAQAISNVSAVIINNGCSSGRTSGGVSTDNNGLASNLSEKGSLKVYPNPISKAQTLFVTFDGDGTNCKAVLKGTDGRTYSCTIEAAAKGALQIKMPSNVAQGTYVIQITSAQKQWVERVVIF